jgi:hypothetical protein
MAQDAVADFVVREASRMIEPTGAAELLGVEAGVARVRYRQGYDPSCADCTVSPDDFREFLKGMFAERSPHVTDVQVELDE